MYYCEFYGSPKKTVVSLYSINWSIFILDTEYVYSAVRTASSYIIQISSRL